MSKEKEIRGLSWSALLLSMTILTLVSVMAFCLYGIYGLSTMIHHQEMNELNLEKEIALINQNTSYEKEINIKDSYENLRGLNNCLYYEESTDTFYKSVCYLVDTKGEVYK